MLSHLYNMLTGTPTPPTPPSVAIQSVRIPADGTPPHLILLHTIPITDPSAKEIFLKHIPDLRSFWGQKEGWHRRDVYSYEARDQSPPQLEGMYFGFKSFAVDSMPMSRHTGFCGDAFVVKCPLHHAGEGVWFEEYDWEKGWVVYEDVSVELLGSELLGEIVRRMQGL